MEKIHINNKVMARILDWGGFQYTVTTNALDGLAAAQRERPDLIIMGTRFYPDDTTAEPWNTDGLCLLQKFHSLDAFRDIPIIIASADCVLGNTERFVEAGAAAFLALPVTPNKVLDAVRKVLGGSDAHPEIIPSPAEARPLTSASQPVVDMIHLKDLTDGNNDVMGELFEIYFKQTPRQLAQMAAAIRDGKADVLRRAAHCCATASIALGMKRIVPQLRSLEQLGETGTLTGAGPIFENATDEFNRIREFLKTLPELTALANLWHSDSKS